MIRIQWTLCLGAALLQWAAVGSALEPFEASFSVQRNGSAMGTMTARLSATGEDRWQYVSTTEGQGGMAGFLGARIEERSDLSLSGAVLQTDRYQYRQKIGPRTRQRSLQRQGADQWVETDNRKSWQFAESAAVLDRHAVVLALAQSLVQDAKAGRVIELLVADKGEAENWRFKVGSMETVATGKGEVQAVRVERQRADSKRRTVSWHDPERQFLPIQVEQTEPDGETMRSVLQTFAIKSGN